MRLVLIGCEYAGKTTLAAGIADWWREQTGELQTHFHDHFLVPELVHKDPATCEAEEAQIATLIPPLLEKFQRYNFIYHMGSPLHDHWMIDWFYADAVYAPLYYGYDRQRWTHRFEVELLERLPDTVMVLLKAAPETIRQRMRARPHPKGLLKEKDIELVLQRFDEIYRDTSVHRRFALDTTRLSEGQTLQEFVRLIEPLLTPADGARIQTHHLLKSRLPGG